MMMIGLCAAILIVALIYVRYKGIECNIKNEVLVVESVTKHESKYESKYESEVIYEAEQVLTVSAEEEMAITQEVQETQETQVKAYEFTINEIDQELAEFMTGLSYYENDVITLEDLRLVKVIYSGFDGKAHQGELVVNKAIAEDVIEIFKELYAVSYAIEKIELIDYYEGDDAASMVANNTSAFNYRVVAGTSHLSNHSYGLAIDINPLRNPYVTKNGIFPSEGEMYANREVIEQGMIIKDDPCYNAFISRGFSWGGEWVNSKDYQHFDIKIKGLND